MPGLLIDPEIDFKTLKINELHPTFAAEIEGVDFSKPIPDDVFNEILAASAKVSRSVLTCAHNLDVDHDDSTEL